jgi:hypothetical protein
MSSTCLTCKYWVWSTLNAELSSAAELDDNSWGQCKRYAPRALVLANPQEGDEKFRTDTLWPETSADDGCGDFEEDEDRVAEIQNGGELTDADFEEEEEDPDADIPEECLATCRALDGRIERLVTGSLFDEEQEDKPDKNDDSIDN